MKKNNKKGFTLVELVIVVAVMAVLVAVAIPVVSSITSSAETAVDKSNARTIESILKLAQAEAAKSGDGAGTLSTTTVESALADAKLGIETGTFYYDEVSGECATTDNTADGYKIVFGGTGNETEIDGVTYKFKVTEETT